jgi:hypothetical protein
MTVLMCEGFENYGDGTESFSTHKTRVQDTRDFGWKTVTGLPNGANIVTGYDGDSLPDGLALEIDDTGSSSARGEFIAYQWPSAYNNSANGSVDEFVVGFRYYNGQLDAVGTVPGRTFFSITQGNFASSGDPPTGDTSKFSIDNDNTTLNYTPHSGTAVSASSALIVDTWHYIEIQFKPTQTGANGGYCKVYVDGTLVIDDTAGSVISASFFKTVGFTLGSTTSGGNNDGPSSTPVMFDDVYAIVFDGSHSAKLGEDVRVIPLKPTSDASPNDWSPDSGGTNYTQIDETDWDETDYVEGDVTADDEHYTLTTMTGVDTVHLLRTDVVCVATDGTPNLHIGFDDGTDDSTDVGVIGTSSTVQENSMHPLDPSGSSWSQSTVNAVEATQRMTE